MANGASSSDGSRSTAWSPGGGLSETSRARLQGERSVKRLADFSIGFAAGAALLALSWLALAPRLFFSSETRRALEEMKVELIATDRYFLPSLLASMSPDGVFLDVVGDEEIRALIPKAAAVGMKRIAVVSRPGRKVQLPAVIEGIRVVVTPESDGRRLVELK